MDSKARTKAVRPEQWQYLFFYLHTFFSLRSGLSTSNTGCTLSPQNIQHILSETAYNDHNTV